MIEINDKNRQEILENYAQSVLDGMDFDTLYAFAYETLVEQKDLLTNEALEIEIKDFYPELLEN